MSNTYVEYTACPWLHTTSEHWRSKAFAAFLRSCTPEPIFVLRVFARGLLASSASLKRLGTPSRAAQSTPPDPDTGDSGRRRPRRPGIVIDASGATADNERAARFRVTAALDGRASRRERGRRLMGRRCMQKCDERRIFISLILPFLFALAKHTKILCFCTN